MSQYLDQVRNLSLFQSQYRSLLNQNFEIENHNTLTARRHFVHAALKVNLAHLENHINELEQLITFVAKPVYARNAGVFLFEGVPCAFMINPPPYGPATDMVNWYAKEYAFDPKLIRFGCVPLIPTPTHGEVLSVNHPSVSKDDHGKEDQNQTEHSDKG